MQLNYFEKQNDEWHLLQYVFDCNVDGFTTRISFGCKSY